MLVGVVSDTHDNTRLASRAGEIFSKEGVDAVIHLGDVISPFTLAALLAQIEVRKAYIVLGNNDGEKFGLQRVAQSYGAKLLEQPSTVEIGGRRLLLLHGFGSPENTVEIVEALAESGRWDAVLYGHTHQADSRFHRRILILNPGDGGGVLSKPSIALIDLKTMKARLLSLEG